jgi:hypothetical protein
MSAIESESAAVARLGDQFEQKLTANNDFIDAFRAMTSELAAKPEPKRPDWLPSGPLVWDGNDYDRREELEEELEERFWKPLKPETLEDWSQFLDGEDLELLESNLKGIPADEHQLYLNWLWSDYLEHQMNSTGYYHEMYECETYQDLYDIVIENITNHFASSLEPIASVEKFRSRKFWTKAEPETEPSLPPAAVLNRTELEHLYQKMSSSGLLAAGTTCEQFLVAMEKSPPKSDKTPPKSELQADSDPDY